MSLLKFLKRAASVGMALVLLVSVIPFQASALTPITVSFQGSVEVKGSKAKESTPFTFTLESVDGAPLPENSEETIQGAGDFTFDGITFTKVGKHYYKITQQAGDAAHYTYDETVYNVTLTIYNNEGALTAAYAVYEEGSEEKSEDILFINTYSEPEPPVETVTPIPTPTLTPKPEESPEPTETTTPKPEESPEPTETTTPEPEESPEPSEKVDPFPEVTPIPTEPSVEPTPDESPKPPEKPAESPEPEPTPDVSEEPTPDVSEEPTPDVSEEPTPDVSEEPTPEETPDQPSETVIPSSPDVTPPTSPNVPTTTTTTTTPSTPTTTTTTSTPKTGDETNDTVWYLLLGGVALGLIGGVVYLLEDRKHRHS